MTSGVGGSCVDILLLGDPARDYLILKVPARGGSGHEDWRTYSRWEMWSSPGGVMMTRDMLSGLGLKVALAGPASIASGDGKHIASLAEVICIDDDGDTLERPELNGSYRLRIKSFDGYREESSGFAGIDEVVPATDFRLLVLNDAGIALRDRKDIWDPALKRAADNGVPIIYKSHMPLAEGGLWKEIASSKAPTIAILQALDLRGAGVRLTRGLSWQQVVEDVWAASKTPGSVLKAIVNSCNHVVVTFDTEAAVVITGSNAAEPRIDLVFDPSRAEGDTEGELPGDMIGKMSAFASGIAKAVLDEGSTDPETLAKAAHEALAGLRAFAEGHMTTSGQALTYPSIEPTNEHRDLYQLVSDLSPKPNGKVRIPYPRQHSEEAEVAAARNLAQEVVLCGRFALKDIPWAEFGDLVTVDRSEIESYRAIDRLLRGYRADANRSKPISILVLGPPGAGKSFGIKQIVKRHNLPFHSYNLSEAGSEDLPGFFHELRDINLTGNTPVAFFDEFDSGGYGLVASFLAPMQDGEFRDGPRVHPTGRGIYIFAGSVTHCARDFIKAAEKDKAAESGHGKKLTDFASRLSGYIDIRGPDPAAKNDHAHVLRRAILLRSMIESRAPSIIDRDTKRASIALGIVNAFLNVGRFNHGARSMEQIIKMSVLGPESVRFTVSDLPERDQLALHVDPGEFEGIAFGVGRR